MTDDPDRPQPYIPGRPDLTVDIDAIEREERDKVAVALLEPGVRHEIATGKRWLAPPTEGVEYLSVELEGTFPQTEVVVLFEIVSLGNRRFGQRRRIWKDDGAYDDGISVFHVNIDSSLTNRIDANWAARKPGPDGITWYGRRPSP